MSVGCIIQARMGSTRLPGKAMADLAGKPLLAWVIERARTVEGIDRVVVATTTAECDRRLLEVAAECGVAGFAGSGEDVLDRYYQAARTYSARTIMRITADCPMLDPIVSERVLARFQQGDVDYASNTLMPTFPDGLDTEVLDFGVLERSWHESRLPGEREHVTTYVRRHPEWFRLANVANDVDLSALRWTVDEPRDLEFVRAVYQQLCSSARPIFGMLEVLALLERHPHLRRMSRAASPNEDHRRSPAGEPQASAHRRAREAGEAGSTQTQSLRGDRSS